MNQTQSALSSLQSSITWSRYKDFDPNTNKGNDDNDDDDDVDEENDILVVAAAAGATAVPPPSPTVINNTIVPPLPDNDSTNRIEQVTVPVNQTTNRSSPPPDIAILNTVQDKNALNHSHDDPYWDTISIAESTIVTIS